MRKTKKTSFPSYASFTPFAPLSFSKSLSLHLSLSFSLSLPLQVKLPDGGNVVDVEYQPRCAGTHAVKVEEDEEDRGKSTEKTDEDDYYFDRYFG